jgi:DNA-binding transcriptional ArsR family regulator
MDKFIWGILAGTKGATNRARIIDELKNRPYNVNQLAEKLELDYKTVKHHIRVLERNNMVTSTGKKYGALYFLSDKMEQNYDSFQEIWEEFRKSNDEVCAMYDHAS